MSGQAAAVAFDEMGLATTGSGLALRERFEKLLAGRWGHLLVLGESGTGRSLALQLFAAVATERGQSILWRQGHMWRLIRNGGETLSRDLWPMLIDIKSDAASILVDDAEDLDGASQAQLLEALQPRRPGLSVHLLASARPSLERLVLSRGFSEGLWKLFSAERIITLSALREDPAQIPGLAKRLVRQIARRFDIDPPSRIHPAALAVLQSCPWPGNVRQLRQVLERAVLSCSDEDLDVGALPGWLLDGDDYGLMRAARASMTLADLESCYIDIVMKMLSGHRSKAAAVLGINRKTLATKIAKQKLSPPAPTRRPKRSKS